jgi:hypothetical protein
MKPGALLTTLREKAKLLSRDGSFVGWFSRQGRDKAEHIPLSDLRVMAVYKGRKTRTYKVANKTEKAFELKDEHPVYMICCPAVFYEGRVHIGGDNWYQRLRGPKMFLYREHVPGSRPSGEFRDVFSNRACNEVTLVTSIKHERALLDRQLCRWGLTMLDEKVAEQDGFNPFGDDEIMPPVFLVPRKRDCLELREGKYLRELVESAVKRDEWHIDGLLGMSAPDRGTACYTQELLQAPPKQSVVAGFLKEEKLAKVVNFSHENECEDRFCTREVEEAIEDRIFRVFGVRQRVDLRSILPEGKEVPMRAGQAFFTPASKELTPEVLKKHWRWEDRRNAAKVAGKPFTDEPPLSEAVVQGLKYVVALTASHDVNGVIALDINVAIGRVEPLVHMGALMCRIQKLVNLEDHLIFESSGVTIDIPHVCARMELQRRSQEFRTRVAEMEKTPGVEIEKPEGKTSSVSSGN